MIRLAFCLSFLLYSNVAFSQGWVEINGEKKEVQELVFDIDNPTSLQFKLVGSNEMQDGINASVKVFEDNKGNRFARSVLIIPLFKSQIVYATVIVQGDVSLNRIIYRGQNHFLLEKNGESRLLLDIKNDGFGKKDKRGLEYPNYVSVVFDYLSSLSVAEKSSVRLTQSSLKALVLKHNTRINKFIYAVEEEKYESKNRWVIGLGFSNGRSSILASDMLQYSPNFVNDRSKLYSGPVETYHISVEYKMDRSLDFPVYDSYTLSYSYANVNQIPKTILYVFQVYRGTFELHSLDYSTSFVNLGVNVNKPFYKIFNATIGINYGISFQEYKQSVSQIDQLFTDSRVVFREYPVSLKNTSFLNYGIVGALEVKPFTKIPLILEVFFRAQWQELEQTVNDYPSRSLFSRLNMTGAQLKVEF